MVQIMEKIDLGKKILVLSAMACSGCAPLAYMLAQNVYDSQPKVQVERFKSAKGVINKTEIELDSYKSNNDTDYFIAVATSGGGYRAAYSTIGVLEALESLPSIKGHQNFLQDVDVFSSVSGSGIAVGYYLSHLFVNQNFNLNKNISNILIADARTKKPNILRTNLDKLLFGGKQIHNIEIQNHFAKIFNNGQKQLRLNDIFIKNNSPKQKILPIWLINTTIFQNMAGLVVTPKNLLALGVEPKIANNIKISTAAVASAAYPMAIPPLKLRSKSCKHGCYIYLIDGGINDNLGIMAALRVVKQAKQKHKILIVLDASDINDTPYSKSKSPPKPLDIMFKLPSMVTESNKQQIQQNINLIAEKTRVIILKLSKDKRAVGITTRFNSSLKEQKLLIKIGRKLVLNSKKIKMLLAR